MTSTGGATREATQARADQLRYAWRVLSVTSLGVLLAAVNTSTLDVALPVVARHFHASATEASWILLSYMLVNTTLILGFGRLADIIGRRRLYLAGLGTLTVASFGCGLAPNAATLIGLRALAAVGGAAIITNTTALLTDAFPVDRLSVGLGLNVTVASAAAVIGPLLGGYFASSLGWRAVFWFNVPTGIVGLGWGRLTLRRPLQRPSREPFDLAGAALSLVVLSGLVLALAEGGALGWTSWPVLLGAALVVSTTPAFLVVQARRRYPLVDLRLFADRERSMAYIAGFLMSVARFALVLLIALYLQAAQGLDPFAAGVRVVPVAAGMMVASPLAGRLSRRAGARLWSTAGLLIAGGGLAELALTIAPHAGYPPLAGGMFAAGFGTGLFMTPNTSSIMASVPANRRGIANGVRSMLQNSGYVVSSALSLAIVTTPLPPAAKQAAYAGQLSSLAGNGLHAFTGAYRLALFTLCGMTVVGAAASLLRNPPPAGGHRT